MSQQGLSRIRQLLEQHHDSVAQAWRSAVAAHGPTTGNAERLAEGLSRLTHDVIGVLAAASFDQAAAQRIGAALVALDYSEPAVLGASQEVLGRMLPALLTSTQARRLQPRLAALLGALATGFASAAYERMLREHETGRRAGPDESDNTLRQREERRLAVFTRLGRDLSAASSADAAAEIIATAADELFGWDAYSLTLFEQDGNTAHVVLNYDLIDGRRTRVPDVEMIYAPSSMARRVINEGPLLLLPENPTVAMPGTYAFGDTTRPSASLMYVPIRSDSAALGMLTIQSYTPRAYTAEDLTLLQALADHCGGALERMRAAAWLQQSEARYRAVVEDQTDLICRYRPDGTFTVVNDAYCRFFGIRADELIGNNIAMLLPEDRRYMIDVHIGSLTPEQPLRTYEYPVPSPRQGLRWQQWTDRGFFDAAGRLVEIQSVGRDVTERKLAEERLRRSEQRLALHIRHMPMAAIEWTAEHVVTGWNPAAERIFGYRAAEAIGRHLYDLTVSPEDRPLARALKLDADSVAANREIIHDGLTKDGRRIMCEWFNTALIDDHGTLIGIASLVRDVTEEHRALEALRRSEATNRALLEAIPDRLYRTLRDGTVAQVKPARDETALDRLVGLNVRDMLPPETARQALEHIERAVSSGELQIFEYRLLIDGQMHDREARIAALDQHEVLVLIRDITERKSAEERLRRSEATNRALLNAMPDLIFRLDRNGRYLDFSGSQQHLLAPSSTFIGKTVDEVLPQSLAEQIMQHLRRAFDTREVQVFEYEFELNGYTRYDEARIAVCGDNEALSVVREITERKRAETARMRARNMESLGVLTAGIAHEFNNLLMVVLGNAELALLDLPSHTAVRANLEHIERAARHAAQLTQQMLAFAGKGQQAFRTLDLASLIETMRGRLASLVQQRAILDYQLQPDLPPVVGDADQLQQVLLYLVANAADAIDDAAGQIRITTGSLVLSQADIDVLEAIQSLAAGQYVFFEVADDGRGMDHETQAKMFDPFYTNKASGSGLSLAAALGIARGHRGTIQVSSALGAGTTVRVMLPAAPQHLEPPDNAVDVLSPRRSLWSS